MSNAIRQFRRKESGEIMLESSIVLVCVLILLLALLSISFMFYQQAMLTTVASEVAADIAKNYKYTNIPMGNDQITLDSFDGVEMCRMSFGRSDVEHAQIERAESYVADRINLTSLGLNSQNPEVECEIVHSGIGRAYVNVTITQETDFFLSGILKWMGIYDGFAFSASASAECLDIISYTSMINFANHLGGELAPLDAFGEAYVNIKRFIQVLTD